MRCDCGQELHYANMTAQLAIERQVAERGPEILVQVAGEDRGVFVPRHYIALHGIRGDQVAELAERYGWRFDD